LKYLFPEESTAILFLIQECNNFWSGTLLVTPFNAGPVTTLKGLWQLAQFAWNKALPSWAKEVLVIDNKTKAGRRILKNNFLTVGL